MKNILKHIADQCILRGLFHKDLGLWDGKMGMSLFLFLMFRYTGNRWYEEFAGELLTIVCKELSYYNTFHFSDGLCGIGWSIELLKAENFINEDTDIILEDIDRQMMNWDITRITDTSLETGLTGIIAYVRSRLDSQRETEHTPFEKSYLEKLNNVCKSKGILWKTDTYSLQNIKNQILKKFEVRALNGQANWQFGILSLYGKSITNYFKDDYNTEQFSHENELYRSAQKNILIFLEESIAIQYGIGTYIDSLLQCFETSIWNVNVITLHKNKDDVSFYVKNGIGYYGFPIPKEQFMSGNPYFEEIYFRSVFYYLALRLNKECKVYCHFNFTRHEVLAECFKNNMNAYVTYTFHYADWKFDLLGNREELERIIKQPKNIKELRIKRKFEKERLFLQNTCNNVIAIAKHSYNMLHDLYGIPYSKLLYIPHGVMDGFHECSMEAKVSIRRKYGFNEHDKILLFVGRMDFMKGTMYLMEAFAELCREGYPINLIMVGTGDYSECLRITNPYWRNIMFTGYLPIEQILELYAVANFGVVPSIHEEFGYVAAEMMLNMLPVVVHDDSGLHEVTNSGKYGVPFIYRKNREVQNLKNAIIKMTMFDIEKDSLREGREWIIKNYSIDLFKERVKNLYEKK